MPLNFIYLGMVILILEITLTKFINNDINLQSIPNSPWNQSIPGAQVNPSGKILSAPNQKGIGEIQRLWQRAN